MGGERFDTPQPESYLFGENGDLNFLGNRPTAVSFLCNCNRFGVWRLIFACNFSFRIHRRKQTNPRKHWKVWSTFGRSRCVLWKHLTRPSKSMANVMQRPEPIRSTLNSFSMQMPSVPLRFTIFAPKSWHQMDWRKYGSRVALRPLRCHSLIINVFEYAVQIRGAWCIVNFGNVLLQTRRQSIVFANIAHFQPNTSHRRFVLQFRHWCVSDCDTLRCWRRTRRESPIAHYDLCGRSSLGWNVWFACTQAKDLCRRTLLFAAGNIRNRK